MSAETTWVLLRVAGIVALAALTISVASGLAGPAVRAPAWRGVLVSVHRASALLGLSLTLGHVVLAVVDPWVEVSAAAAVVPGASTWEPMWVGVGAVAVDLLVVVAVTSALRSRGPRAWWTAHVLTYPAWLLATGHALAIGTDAWRTPYLGAGAVGALLVAAAAVARARAARRGYPAGVPPQKPTAVPTGATR
jgi:sulfoxide reductase heme-binding subunit YedZ